MDIFDEMARAWPSAVVSRAEIKTFTGGGLSGKTLANFDSQGKGPGGRVIIGRQTCYDKKSLVDWLRKRAAAKVAQR